MQDCHGKADTQLAVATDSTAASVGDHLQATSQMLNHIFNWFQGKVCRRAPQGCAKSEKEQ